MNQKPKQLKFKHQPAQDILAGKKTVTFRFFDEKYIAVGDEVEVIDKVEKDNPASWLKIGTAHISSVTEKRVADLSTQDWEGHTTYDSLEQFMQTYSDMYSRPIHMQTPVKIICFTFTAYNKPELFISSLPQDRLPAEVKLFCDGGSRGNPGPSAGGFVVLDMQDIVQRESSKYLGITTNNQAEYHSLKGGLELCLKEGARSVHVYMDSLLVINQMKGIFKVKNRDLWPIHDAIKQLVPKFSHIEFTHVPRELNKLADAEVNKALDAVKEENRL